MKQIKRTIVLILLTCMLSSSAVYAESYDTSQYYFLREVPIMVADFSLAVYYVAEDFCIAYIWEPEEPEYSPYPSYSPYPGFDPRYDSYDEWMDQAMLEDAQNAYRDYQIAKDREYDSNIPSYGYPW